MQGFVKISKFIRKQNKKTENVIMEGQNGREYIQLSPHARFALATRLLCFNEDKS